MNLRTGRAANKYRIVKGLKKQIRLKGKKLNATISARPISLIPVTYEIKDLS
jgi:hypothetical protein